MQLRILMEQHMNPESDSNACDSSKEKLSDADDVTEELCHVDAYPTAESDNTIHDERSTSMETEPPGELKPKLDDTLVTPAEIQDKTDESLPLGKADVSTSADLSALASKQNEVIMHKSPIDKEQDLSLSIMPDQLPPQISSSNTVLSSDKAACELSNYTEETERVTAETVESPEASETIASALVDDSSTLLSSAETDKNSLASSSASFNDVSCSKSFDNATAASTSLSKVKISSNMLNATTTSSAELAEDGSSKYSTDLSDTSAIPDKYKGDDTTQSTSYSTLTLGNIQSNDLVQMTNSVGTTNGKRKDASSLTQPSGDSELETGSATNSKQTLENTSDENALEKDGNITATKASVSELTTIKETTTPNIVITASSAALRNPVKDTNFKPIVSVSLASRSPAISTVFLPVTSNSSGFSSASKSVTSGRSLATPVKIPAPTTKPVIQIMTTQSFSTTQAKPKPIVLTLKQLQTQTKEQFNVKAPPVTGNVPTPQDVKDGVVNLKPTAKVLYKIGLSLMRENVYSALADLIGSQLEAGTSKYTEAQYTSLKRTIKTYHTDNQSLTLLHDKVCNFIIDGRKCGFRTESLHVMESHLSEAHVNRSQRLFCARCDFSTAANYNFKTHMMAAHGTEGTIVKPKAFFPCKLCHYETNHHARILVHQQSCSRSFMLIKNLKPSSNELTHLTPYGEEIFIEPPTKPKVVKLQNPYSVNSQPKRIIQPKQSIIAPANIIAATGSVSSGTLTVSKAPLIIRPIVFNSSQQSAPISTAATTLTTSAAASAVPSANGNTITQIGGRSTAGEICQCELCDGYIQGTQALKVHMQWCHNLNITHLDKPVLQCRAGEMCSEKFWTIQGLAKHSKQCNRGSIVIDILDEKENCFICTKRYSYSIVAHVLTRHIDDLKEMVRTKRCQGLRCQVGGGGSCIFHDIETLQTHLAMCHRLEVSGLQALTLNINAKNIKFQPFCSICKLKFTDSQSFAQHCAAYHVHKCKLCKAQCSTSQGLQEHMLKAHRFKFCHACRKEVTRVLFTEHLNQAHKINGCRVELKRLSDNEYNEYSKIPRLEDWYDT